MPGLEASVKRSGPTAGRYRYDDSNHHDRAVLSLCLALAYMALTPATPAAADREHQQIMADMRMLQEQTQQLQALMNDLGDALEAVNSRIDDQSGLERKSFADGKVQMDAMSGDIRIVREKVDETNVRLGSMLQELETIRGDSRARRVSSARRTLLVTADGSSHPWDFARRHAAAIRNRGRDAPSGINLNGCGRRRTGDYTAGNYSLAVRDSRVYLSSSQRARRRTKRSCSIGESLSLDKKDADAVIAYDRVIANYPNRGRSHRPYYKRGQALERLGDSGTRQESYDAVTKQFPDPA